jgi:hypothetical protein
MPPPMTHLPLGCRDRLTNGQSIGVLCTADRHGRPHTSIVSWFRALDGATIALALDCRTRHMRNLCENSRVSLLLLSQVEIYEIAGCAAVARDRMSSSPFPMAAVHIRVELVIDQTVSGVEFTGPSYRYSVDKAHRSAIEDSVLSELLKGTATFAHLVELVEDEVSC